MKRKKIKSTEKVSSIIFLLLISILFTPHLCAQENESATLIFFRKKQLQGAGAGIGIQINSNQLQKLKNGQRLIVELHQIDSEIEITSYNKLNCYSKNGRLRIKLREGQKYYIEVFWDRCINFVLKDSLKGNEEFRNDNLYNDKLEEISIINSKFQNIVIEDTITYRSKNVLEWSDFRMEPDLNDTSKLHLNLTIVTFTKKVDVWFGIITVESFAGIRRDSSWIKPEFKTDQLLEYVQLKYDIANYYAKKTEEEINGKKINAGRTNKVDMIIEKYIREMKITLKKYDLDTDFGTKGEMIDMWSTKLINGIYK